MEFLLIVFGVVLLAIVIIAVWINKRQDEQKNAQIDKLTDDLQKFSNKIEPKSLNLMDEQQKGVFGSQKSNKPNLIKEDSLSPFTWVPVTSYKNDKVSPKINLEHDINDEKDEEEHIKEHKEELKEVKPLVESPYKLKEVKPKENDIEIPGVSNDFSQDDFTSSILLVDDSLTVLKFTGKLLTKNNYNVITKMDGWEGYTYLQDIKVLPDVIISDIEMPNMDGIEFIRKVRQDKRFNHIPVLIISASAEKHLDLMEEQLIQGFLHKPYKENDLLEQLKYVLLNN